MDKPVAVQSAWTHTTVLLGEAVDALLGAPAVSAALPQAPVFVDATFGRGGHSRLLLSRLPPDASVIAFDQDPDAIAEAATIIDPRFTIRHQSFSHLSDLPAASASGVLLDLGISSPQVDNPARGFSFRQDGPLDMRMDSTRGASVAQWLAQATVEHITEVIRDYGEERFAGAIAKAIVARRQAQGPLVSTAELAQLVADTVKTREPGKDPATRTFQAFRIFINAELEELQQALTASLAVLRPGGRLVVISFHSLEDRIVKQFIAQHSRQVFDRRAPFAAPRAMRLMSIGRSKPSDAEVAGNPRARSAVMRVAERTTSMTTAELA
ncbi:MAG: 16S rRNA (cytosine(1402)-N(4))-methyltransferase RsmH [Rhodoferax sp.]|nr:16S rRNA (cytosine(1402)-N(4))-methyltransferase RsmH [Rhodoferax sp.]